VLIFSNVPDGPFIIEVTDTRHLQTVMSGLRKIKGVLTVTRFFEKLA